MTKRMVALEDIQSLVLSAMLAMDEPTELGDTHEIAMPYMVIVGTISIPMVTENMTYVSHHESVNYEVGECKMYGIDTVYDASLRGVVLRLKGLPS